MENKLNEEKNKNKILNDKINKLTEELDNANKNIKKLTDKLNSINLKNNNSNELQQIINMKNDEINKLKSQINDNSLENIQPGEKILSVCFTSWDQSIHNFNLPCKDSELFVRIEEKLYNEFSEYKEKETYFLVNGLKIRRFKTLKENNIKSGSIIILNIIEE